MVWPPRIPRRLMLLASVVRGAAAVGVPGGPRLVSALCGAGGPSGRCHVQDGYQAGCSAWGVFDDTISERGFATLAVTGTVGKPDEEIAFAAGLVEGYLSAERTSQHFNNTFSSGFGFLQDPKRWASAVAFLSENDDYVKGRAASEASSSAFWRQAALALAQLDGLLQGHALAASEGRAAVKLDRVALLFLNALADLRSVLEPLGEGGQPLPADVNAWTAVEAARFATGTSCCSALVKVSADLTQLWTAHNTWRDFSSMLRVAKLYSLPFAGVAAQKAAFPGYPGALSSLDDFFVLSSGLVVQATTNAVFPPLARKWTPRAAPTWLRATAANRLARDGRSWTSWFATESGGAASGQWMVVDYSRFQPGRPLPDGTLWLLEQVPGYVESADVTPYLYDGYWPSYSEPFFPEVRSLSGGDRMARRFGDPYSYGLSARAKILRRDAAKAADRQGVRRLIRYNDWQNEPFSAKGLGGPLEPRSAENAIAARNDMIPRNSTDKGQHALRGAWGNTDGKVVSHADVLSMQFDLVVGPTNDQQPSFEWSGEWAGAAHEGHPRLFDFEWYSVTFRDLLSLSGAELVSGLPESLVV